MTRLLILPFLAVIPLAGMVPVGNWNLASAPDVPAVIDQATEPMNFFIRPFARSRLRKTNIVFQRIQVSRTPSEFTIQFDDRQPMHLPADGTPVVWARDDGEKLTVLVHLAGDDLEQTFRAQDGERTNVFHLDPDSRVLRLKVTVQSGRLPGPVTYTVDYKPAP